MRDLSVGLSRTGLLLTILFLLTASVSSGQPLPAGPGLRLNSDIPGHQTNPAAATGIRGNTVVVWETFDEGGACQAIRGQRMQSGGELLGFEFEVSGAVSCDGGPDSFEPKVAVSPVSNSFVAAWGLKPSLFPSSGRAVLAQRFDFFAGPLGGPVTVTQSDGNADLVTRAVTYNSQNGRFAIAWDIPFENSDTVGGGLFGRVFNANGTPVSNPFRFNLGIGSAIWAGRALSAAWVNGDPFFGIPNELYLRRFNVTGAPIGNIVEVSALTEPREIVLAANRAGDTLIVWSATEGSARGVYARLYTANGAPRTATFRVNTGPILGLTANPAVASDGRSFLVAWDDEGDPPSVFARLVDANGAPSGQPFSADPFSEDLQQDPAVTAGPEGSFLITWEGLWPGSSEEEGLDILGQRFAMVTPLTNGSSLTGLSDNTGDHIRYFSLEVPPGARDLRIQTSGGGGDTDLYVRYGALPTPEEFVRSSNKTGNGERIRIPRPPAGTLYIGLRAAPSYSGLTLHAGFRTPSRAQAPHGEGTE